MSFFEFFVFRMNCFVQIIERIEVYATIDNGSNNWILPLILIVVALMIVVLGFVAYKMLNASALLKVSIEVSKSDTLGGSRKLFFAFLNFPRAKM